MYHELMLENQTIFTKMVFERLAGEDLTVGQPKVLEYLFSHNGAIQKDIADACLIEPATLTSLLSRMEKNDLIVRKNKNEDKRYSCVYLTEKGKKSGKIVIEKLNELEQNALINFSKKETEMFISFLKKANRNLKNIKEAEKNESNDK
ncbi:MAG: MarR family transcriptional regulator [Acetobacter sp.]|nr:MarR family transcriptional regulator [Bacteroides sp.]MCM1341766.1 MarR family transcriptional regulator [Acetobacter sp.]MCM1433109.1 MarR family transcriptional regulator [Clostridiales bacterium]